MAVKRAKLGAGLRLYGLRPGYGSLLIAEGHDLGTVSRALGHAKASITPRPRRNGAASARRDLQSPLWRAGRGVV